MFSRLQRRASVRSAPGQKAFSIPMGAMPNGWSYVCPNSVVRVSMDETSTM